MESGLIHQGRVALQAGEILRLRNPAGRHISVARGSVWITQESDPRDYAIGSGASFRFDRDGLALVTPVGGAAKLIFEDGLVPEKVAQRGGLLIAFSNNR